MQHTPTLPDAIKELDVEIAIRERVYPGWIAKGKLTHQAADFKLASMRLAAENLRDIEHLATGKPHSPTVPYQPHLGLELS